MQALRDRLGNSIIAATAVMNGHDEIVIDGKVREITLDGVDEEYARVRNLELLQRPVHRYERRGTCVSAWHC